MTRSERVGFLVGGFLVVVGVVLFLLTVPLWIVGVMVAVVGAVIVRSYDDEPIEAPAPDEGGARRG